MPAFAASRLRRGFGLKAEPPWAARTEIARELGLFCPLPVHTTSPDSPTAFSGIVKSECIYVDGKHESPQFHWLITNQSRARLAGGKEKQVALPKALLRMKDLKCVGIRNWPTLKRRVLNDNFPPGRYVGQNTRVWDEAEVERWWATRPSAAPPKNVKPAPSAPTEGSGRVSNNPVVTPGYSEPTDSPQSPLCTGGKR
jgi:hypothetical protein